MANYDATIRVGTSVDNSDLIKTQKEINKLMAQLERVRERSDKVEALGGSKKSVSRQLESLGYDAELLEDKLATATERLETLQNAVSTSTSDGFKKASDAGNKFFNAIANGSKKSSGLIGTIGSRLKGITLSLLVFNWISKGFGTMVSGMQEGFKNLTKYSSDYNTAMSAMKSQSAQLKNGLAAAFEPIANMAIPYLTKLIGWLNSAAETMSKFLAAISGKATYTRAKKQVVDYAKSLNTAKSAAQGALAAFDSINVLSKNDSSGGTGGEATGADAFEEVKLTAADYSWAEDLYEKLEKIKNIAFIIGEAFLLWKIVGFVNSLSAAGPLMTALGGAAAAVGAAILGWHIGQDLYELITGDKIEMGFGEQLNAIKESFLDGSWRDALKLWWEDIWGGICAFGETLGTFFTGLWTKIKDLGTKIADFFSQKVAVKLKKSFTDMKNGLVNFFKGIPDKLKTLLNGAVTVAKKPINMIIGFINKMISAVESMMNTIVNALNSLSFKVPDWVYGIGGKTFGFNIPQQTYNKIPYLAQGAVIPPNHQFLAVLGDQTSGTNVEAPLATIEDAVQNVLDRNGRIGDITIRFEGSLAELGRLLKPVIDAENSRIGRNFRVSTT